MRKKLIKKQEVLIRTGLTNLSSCNINKLDTIIWTEFKGCLGLAFYVHLIKHLADYDEAQKWDVDTDYSEGDVVIYEGCYWIANEDVESGSEPNGENECWGFAPKFTSECLEGLWCDGSLGDYLSYLVVRESIIPSSVKFTSEGIVRPVSKDYDSVSKSDKEGLVAHYSKCAQCEFEKIDWYMRNNNEDCCFDLYKGIARSCCGGCGCEPIKCVCEDDSCNKTGEFELLIC